MIKPISFNKLSCNPVYYSLYCESFFPIVSVSPRQNIQMMTVLHTSAKDLDTGLMSLEIVTAMGTDMPIENTNIIMNVNNVVFLVIWSQNTLMFSIQSFPLQRIHRYLNPVISGHGTQFRIKIRMAMPINPKIPSKKTIFKGCITYLLKSIFQVINAIVLNISETSSRTTPMICQIVVWSQSVFYLSDIVISNICTRVMPKNARKHPKIEDLVNYLVKHILENITVVIITPPLEICQTDPAISPSDIYASNDESRSITPGTIGKYIGHGFFRNSALSIRLLDFLHNLKIMQGIKHRASAKNITPVCTKGCINLALSGNYGIF